MRHQITLQPSGIQFETRQGESILEGALRNGIAFPHRCTQGGCSTCLCRKLDGEIAYPYMEPFLTAREQEEGWMFACLASAQSDLEVELP
jgi:ferredoxin